MPIFEFLCEACGRKSSHLVGMTADDVGESCPGCGNRKLRKLVSRPGRFRTEDQRVADASDRMDRMGDPESDAETRRLVRDFGSALDDDASDEMEEMLEADLEGDSSSD